MTSPLPFLPALPCRHTPGCRGVGDHVCAVEGPPKKPRRRARLLKTLPPEPLRYYLRGLGLVLPAPAAPASAAAG